MDKDPSDEFLSVLQKSILPAVWARGLTLARAKAVRLEKRTDEEILLRVSVPDRPVSQKVSLWPGDEDAYCDCVDKVESCVHIAASVAALRNGFAVTGDVVSGKRVVRYGLSEAEGSSGKLLRLERSIDGEPLVGSLLNLIASIQSGRVVRPHIDANQDDLAIDQILSGNSNAEISGDTWARLLPFLHTVGNLETAGFSIGGIQLQMGRLIPEYLGVLRSEKQGFRLRLEFFHEKARRYLNGPVIIENTLHVFPKDILAASERDLLLGAGRFYSAAEVPRLLTEVLPALEKAFEVKRDDSVPTVSDEPPRIVLRMEPMDDGILSVVPTIEYLTEMSFRDRDAEAKLVRKLETDYHLKPGHRALLRGTACAAFLQRVAMDPNVISKGTGSSRFTIESELVPEISIGELEFSALFRTSSGKSGSLASVLEAWQAGEGMVSLLEGGFAPLPLDWLSRFGEPLQRLMDLRASGKGRLPTHAAPTLLNLAEESGAKIPEASRKMKERFDAKDGIPEAELPADLRADLRVYQRAGVNWLSFLLDSGMGALLADDMGLGKTLQAICVMHGKVLVVCPKSVISAWRGQLEKFRPGLPVAVYSEGDRIIQDMKGVHLITYGLLRRDIDAIATVEWDLAILDEGQTIKNPSSQVSQAAHRLRAKSRISLSGTPVENRLDDLWSQFEFINPGLLGTHAAFQREFAEPISRGDPAKIAAFRRRIRPFILRRLKSEVAPELPARTEVILRSEFSRDERALYEALLASTRKEVLSKLDDGASPMKILELLLRLRQTCCHPALVPGQFAESSSKLELLTEKLSESIAGGHRALVFSQWTSFLDLIEARVESLGFTYSRLDGSTRDRDRVVSEFQAEGGPSVLLLSLKAGGVGLTLTAADHVYLMDSWWNPATEEQAADRVHRIGQENPVLITRLITEESVEEKILLLQAKKRALSDSVLSGDVGSAVLRREDLLGLLE